ncbi:MAG: ribbon-helix-helix domain-containing protein [Ilumatobacteraceae bacterium]
MRTTVTIDADVMAAIDQLRHDEGIGVSDAVNRLIRERLARPGPTATYRHEVHDLGLQIDVANIGDVLDLLDEPDPDPADPLDTSASSSTSRSAH